VAYQPDNAQSSASHRQPHPAGVSVLIHGPPLPPRLRPTLAILLVPPAAGALLLADLTGSFGPGPLAALDGTLFLPDG
jgi:tellurite resistance protein